ncbi:probable cytochrome P450 6d5 [Contarinia nasturtii]|uniref:probable cytochrome P450 6d5 n=1 Tax=Contarinia nasturtii TaxID=265458 RepID=UPI0012D3CC6D|nr:probable cytochrome P450 6d5 [Contarinia nasturtii]
MIIVYLLLFLVSVLYLWIKHMYSYWERTPFSYIKPSMPFGNVADSSLGRKCMGMNLYDLYKSSNEPIVGIYLLFRPALLARDADLVKCILSTDANSFYDRGIYHNPNDPVANNMLMMTGQEWKTTRGRLTPTFTSGKLKGMMPSIISIGERLREKVAQSADTNGIVEIKDLTIRFGLDVIGTVAFGLDVNTLDNPNDPFRDMERNVNNGQIINRIRLIGAFFCPKILYMLHMSSLSEDFKSYMVNMVRDTMEYREKHNTSRNDLIQLLMDLRKTGKVKGDNEYEKIEQSNENSEEIMTVEQCAGQVGLFYLAGFDTTASAIANCLFELSRNPTLMQRLHDEIDEVLKRHDNVISYESINEMTFLEYCVLESLRKYPTLPFLNRICTKDYPIPNTDLVIKEGTPIIISHLGLMRDAKYFPEPDKFMPDRFSESNPNYNANAFIPFGDGPRTCIGLRMGKMVTKIGLIMLLQKHNFECMEKNRELEFDNHSVTLVLKNGINLKIINRN